MKWAVSAAAVLLMIPGVAAAQATEDAPARITVRIYNNFGVPAEDLQAARSGAEAILHAAGLDIVWLDCWFRDREPAEASAQCRQPRGANELVLRLQRGNTETKSKFTSMGFSMIGAGPAPPYLSSVFVDVVQNVARGAAADARRVLGLAMAHEIGHLLLNNPEHAKAGLMRADWTRNELHRNVASDWRFLEAEGETMRADVATREAEQLALLR